MDRYTKDEPTGKSLVCKKALPISEKNWKKLLGGGGGGIHPPGHRRVKMLKWQPFLPVCRIMFWDEQMKELDQFSRLCFDHNQIWWRGEGLLLGSTFKFIKQIAYDVILTLQ